MSGSQTISSGVTSVIGYGMTADGYVVLDGGTLDIHGGGVASNTVVSTGGLESDDGTVAFETVSAGGTEILTMNARAQGAIIAGGWIRVELGAIATGTTIDGGILEIDGGVVSASVVNAGGSIDVGTGTAFGDTVFGGFEILTQSAAVASASTVASGGMEFVADGTAISATISAGGTQEFGYLIVEGHFVSEGIASATTLIGGGVQVDATLAYDNVVQSGGGDIVSGSGAVASGSTIYANGVEFVTQGTAIASLIEAVGTQFIEAININVTTSKNVASATTIAAGGVQVDDGVAFGDVIASRGLVFNAGTTSGSLIQGGTEYVTNGVALAATVSSGLLELAQGSASATTILAGGTIVVSGSATGDNVSGGNETIDFHGIVASSVVTDGGYELAEGSATSTTVGSGGVQEASHGPVFAAAVQSGGRQIIDLGATARDDTIAQGATIYDSGTLLFDSGDTTTIAGQIVASGMLMQSGAGTLVLAAAEPGFAGRVALDGGAIEIEQPSLSVISSYQFTGDTGTLRFDGTSDGSVISGFSAGTTIDLAGLALDAAATTSLTGTNMLDVLVGGAIAGQVQLDHLHNYTGEYFHLTPDAGAGTDVTVDGTPCYLAGTLLLTDRGEVAIEALRHGDLLVTHDGRHRPILWIGQRSYARIFAAGNRDVWPVRIRAGALGDGIPRRDLFVSPQHALFLDGVLVPAIALVDGVTISQVPVTEDLRYFHVELESHDVVLAEGAPAESFVDDDSRGMFSNAASYDGPRRAPLRCAPFVEDGHALAAIRRHRAAG